MSEKVLQTKINEDLRVMKVCFYHKEKGAYHKNRTHNSFKFDKKDKNEPRKAWPDLMIMPGHGRIFYVELKNGNIGKLSDEQIAFKDWAVKAGYRYYLVTNLTGWELVKVMEGLTAESKN